VKNPNPAQRRLKELTCSENQKRRRCDIAATPAAFASKTRQLRAFTSTSAFGPKADIQSDSKIVRF